MEYLSTASDDNSDTRRLPRQILPFTVRVVKTAQDLERAVEIRAEAYRRHQVPATEKLNRPEANDYRDDVILLIAESKLDGAVVGTMRIQSNIREPLLFEKLGIFPQQFKEKRAVEFMRLAVTNGSRGRLVTAALAKAGYRICQASGIEYAFVTARYPVDLLYYTYQFDNVLPGKTIQLEYAPGVNISLLALRIETAAACCESRNPPLFKFMILTEHPDIDIDYSNVRGRLTG